MKLFSVLQTSFENFDSTIKSYLSKVLGSTGSKYSYTQIFGALYDGIKSIMQNTMFYIEDALTEQNIKTAYRKSSIYSLAKISGYEPYYGSAATGIIQCNVILNAMNNNTAPKIYIKNGSTIIDNNTGNIYSVQLPTEYMPIDSSKPLFMPQFKVVQGIWKTVTYVSKGDQLETINITTQGLYDISYIEVKVDGVQYSSAACLYDMENNGLQFVATAGYDNELDIMFGNGVHGKQLSEGQTINIKYLIHDGISGNLSKNSNYDLVFRDPIYDDDGNKVNDYSFLNLSLYTDITGGNDSDTIDNVRKMVGYNSRSLVLASENNFKLFLNRFSFVGQSNIWADENSLDINAICLSNFKNTISDYTTYFNAADNNELTLTDYQKSIITTSLDESKNVYGGTTFKFLDPIIYKFAAIILVKAPKDYSRDTIKDEISNALKTYFVDYNQNQSFIAISDITKYVLDNIKYLESIDISFISDQKERASKRGYWYKYERKNISGIWKYVKTKITYDSSDSIGLDEYGNISVDSKFELPVLSNNVMYYPDKNKNDAYLLDAINIIYI